MSGDKTALLLSHEDAMRNASMKMRISSKFRFRTATIKDIEHVQALERESWIEPMQHEEKHLIMRLKTVPPRFFLLETLNDGKWKILGVIQTQRINSVEDILRVHWTIEDSLYEANGKVLQLLRVNTYKKTNPKEGKGIPTGALLRDFCITYAKELRIKTVCAVTRTTDFINAKENKYKDYALKLNASNGSNDVGLNFHISRGATILKAIEKWRPEDVDNDGYGVLIAYDVFHLNDTMDKEKIHSIYIGEQEIKDFLMETIKKMGIFLPEKATCSTPFLEFLQDSLVSNEIIAKVNAKYETRLTSIDIFNYPTIQTLAMWIKDVRQGKREEMVEKRKSIRSSFRRDSILSLLQVNQVENEIAIVGMSCRFAGGIDSPEMLWDAIQSGKNMVGKVPFDRWDAHALAATDPSLTSIVQQRMMYGGFVHDLDMFDATAFNLSSAEASAMDPQQRLLLEHAYIAFDDARLTKDILQGKNVGVFVGISANDASELSAKKEKRSIYAANSSTFSAAAGRISFVFGLHGPCVAYDTACSSSLVALHGAMRALQHGECDMALVMGVNVMLTPTTSSSYSTAGMTSPTGRCHTFDESADGYARAEGCGAVVLKRMDDAVTDESQVHAVVHAVSIAQDGTSASLTAPNGNAQELLLQSALDEAGLTGMSIDYLEAHGTGTALGDPIEISALSNIMKEGRDIDSPLVMGAVKANIGHAEPAAGIAGLIKAIMVLQHEQAPPNPELRSINPKIQMAVEGFPVHFPTKLESLRQYAPSKAAEDPLIAGISSFGYAGTIAHAIIGQPPQDLARKPTQPKINDSSTSKKACFVHVYWTRFTV